MEDIFVEENITMLRPQEAHIVFLPQWLRLYLAIHPRILTTDKASNSAMFTENILHCPKGLADQGKQELQLRVDFVFWIFLTIDLVISIIYK